MMKVFDRTSIDDELRHFIVTEIEKNDYSIGTNSLVIFVSEKEIVFFVGYPEDYTESEKVRFHELILDFDYDQIQNIDEIYEMDEE